MLKRGIFIYILLLFCISLEAQHVSHRVLVPAAAVVSNNGYSVSQTIGEPVVKYIYTDNFQLTQGFQQPRLIGIEPAGPQNGNGVKVYPNPVKYDLTMELFGERSIEFTVTIFGINGSIYYKNVYPCIGNFRHKIVLNISDYKSGTYFVRVVAADGTIARLFKIEKM